MTEHEKMILRSFGMELDGFVIYNGPFYEVDMNVKCYCPRCAAVMIPSDDLLSLKCLGWVEGCDYVHSNVKARERDRVIWGEGYQYPKSYEQVISEGVQIMQAMRAERRLAAIKAESKCIKRHIKLLNKREAYEAKRTTLSNTPND